MTVQRAMPAAVLCAIADDDRRHDVVATGRALAAAGGLRPLFVHVAEVGPPSPAAVGFAPGLGAPASGAHLPGGDYDLLRERALDRGRRLLGDAGIESDDALVAVGDPAAELDRLAVEHDALLVVVGDRGRGAITGALLGSVSRALARIGSRPVLIARSDVLPAAGGPVVCAVDIGDEAFAAPAAHAARLSAALDRPLVLVHVVGLEPLEAMAGPVPVPVAHSATGHDLAAAQRRLQELAAGLPAEHIECVVLEGSPVAQRLEGFAAGRRADLLVVGCRGGGFLRTALEGSVSLDLVRHGSRPVVVVPPG